MAQDHVVSSKENEIENKWKEGSYCEIYCESKKRWFPGLIVNVSNEKTGQKLEVKQFVHQMTQPVKYGIK